MKTLSIHSILLSQFLLFSLWANGAHPLIPAEYSTVSESRLNEGVVLADKFRRELLLRGRSGERPIDVIGRACVEFRGQMSRRSDGLIPLKSFKIRGKHIVEAIEGDRRFKRWGRTFDSFGGKWFGKWDQMEVDHHWFPTFEFTSPHKIKGFHDVYLHTGQFAWIGDGFGWNLIASEDSRGKKGFVLGTVYHVEANDPLRVRNHRPHVGVICAGNRIIWITRGEIFFEERFDGGRSSGERYAITGFRYRFDGRTLTNEGNAFQTIYTRKPDSRPEWRQFHLGVKVR